MHEAFKEKLSGNNFIQEVRTIGTIIAIELKSEDLTSYTNSLRKKIYQFFLERNILMRPLGNVFYIVPPFILSSEDLQTIYTTIEEFLTELDS